MKRIPITAVTCVCLLAWSGFAPGQDYALDWWTVDGGGDMWSSGGSYELSGTIGQSDAGMIGDGSPGDRYDLAGGFWATPPCWCLADINNDGLRNGSDVQDFVDFLLGGGANCACADVVADGVLNMTDVTTFVSGLLAGAECP